MIDIRVEVRSEAPPEAVWKLVADGASWPLHSQLGSFELEREGEEGGESVGAVRVFRTRSRGRTYVSREQLVEIVPGRRLVYVLLSGLAVRDYRAEVDLSGADGGALLRWHSSFRPKIPGTGRLYERALRTMLTDLATGLAAGARD